MIKTEKGRTEISGNIPEIKADFSMVVDAVFKVLSGKLGEETAKEEMQKSFDMAFLSKEEIFEELKNFLETLEKLCEE